ncbi:hypothetical protein PHOSAC3_121020 [Mesotoga infera]|nr:hypothetical protein PHOSAC3_121020 [Mesotoga infera]
MTPRVTVYAAVLTPTMPIACVDLIHPENCPPRVETTVFAIISVVEQ